MDEDKELQAITSQPITVDPSLSVLVPPPKAPILTLTSKQQEAIDLIVAWMEDPLNNQFKLGGYAGTGKTTIIKIIREILRKKYVTVVCAFTGKAVDVLQRKSIIAQTIHSLIYDVEVLPGGGVEFYKKSFLDGAPDLIIVDEGSMISTEIYRDLLSFDKKYLFVGDPGQLEPVGDNPNLMERPDFTLTEIHRQAEKSPIITLATAIRNGEAINHVNSPGLIVRPKQINSIEALSVDQIICARNKTRHTFNDKLRLFKKLAPNSIVEGEKLICLRNNSKFAVYNGMILFVRKIKREDARVWYCDLEDEAGRTSIGVPVWKEPFQKELNDKPFVPKDVVWCGYGYVITCHKSQGSEWNKVLVWDEWMPPKVWDMKRWRYTAVTRAAEQLIYNI